LPLAIAVAERSVTPQIFGAMVGGNPCAGLRKQLVAHERKLRESSANPEAHDSAGSLTRSPPERRDKIVQGRIRKLERQIRSFRRQLEECERLHQRR
jgi:hypothetical protein